MIYIPTTYIKPRSWYKYLFLLGPVIFCIVYLADDHKDPVLLYVGGGVLALWLCFWWLMSKMLITVDNDGLTYKTAFKERSISWKDITRSYLKVVNTGKSNQRYWYFDHTAGKPLYFSTDSFSRESIKTIAGALVDKCPAAEIEEKIRGFANGKFPWYMF